MLLVSKRGVEYISTGYEPREQQQLIHNSKKRFKVVVAHRRMGKRIAIDELIPTPKGFVKNGDLKDGDIIFGHDGKPCKVLKAHPVEQGDMYEVVFDSGLKVKADAEHLWYIEPAFSKVTVRENRKPWACGITMCTLELKMLVDAKETCMIPVSHAEYKAAKLPIDPYWFGYWLGNGSKSEPLITTCDEIKFKYKPTKVTEAPGCEKIYFGGQDLASLLKELKVYKNKHIPNVYKFSSMEQRMELICGLMDSDGTVTGSGNCEFDQSKKDLFEDVVEVLRSCGFKVSVSFYDKKGGKREYRALFSAGPRKVFNLERKQSLVRENYWSNIRHKVVAVNKVKNCKARCITVDDSKSVYLAGKGYVPTHNTVCMVNELADRGFKCKKRNPQLAYIAPTYTQAKSIAWEMMKEYVGKYPGATFHEAELRCDIPRPWLGDKVRIKLLGAENPNSIRGMYLDGAVLDETQEMSSVVWTAVLRPALSDRAGWAIFIGTPKGKNFLKDLWDDSAEDAMWDRFMFKASETKLLPAHELSAAKRTMGEDLYNQEYECDFAGSLVGAYYKNEFKYLKDNNRITSVPYDKSVPVFTGWDLGIGDTTAIWLLQAVGKEIHVIDYIENSGEDIAWYVRELAKYDYFWGEDMLPHDAAARELQTGKSREQALRDLGRKHLRVLPRHRLEDGIQATRQFLPLCYFDKSKCERGLEALEMYQRKWDERNALFSSKPLHNWASHGSDAFRTAAMGFRPQYSNPKDVERFQHSVETADLDYNIYDY